ncbi:MAG: ATP-binding protein [Phycisphaerae bacterium]
MYRSFREKYGVFAPALPILAGWAFVASRIHVEYTQNLQVARGAFRTEHHDRAMQTGAETARLFRTLYEQLRTIARLPGVRRISRDDTAMEFHGGGEHFDGDARLAVQEIYNSLATSVDVSEVYIVPADLDPDQVNPRTGKPDEPLVTFDELIVGRSAALADDDARTKHEHAEAREGEEGEEIEEIEIFEYRLMKQQLAWMRANVPSEASIAGLEYPAVCGPEVITCDNRRYSLAHPDDKDRSGLVYSVPFFDLNGRLSGCVSAVLLTHAIEGMLTNDESVIINRRHGYAVTPTSAGCWSGREGLWRDGRVDPELVFCETQSLDVVDADGEWLLWSGVTNDACWASPGVRAARQTAFAAQAGAAAAALALALIFTFVRRTQIVLRSKNSDLEHRVKERTEELRSTHARLVETSRQAGMADVASGILHNVGNVLNNLNVSTNVLTASIRNSKIDGLARLSELLEKHRADLAEFIARDDRGRHVPEYLARLAAALSEEQNSLMRELSTLQNSVEHVNQIIQAQHTFASGAGHAEPASLREIVEGAIAIMEAAHKRHGIRVESNLAEIPTCMLDRSKLMQILVNLLTNAKDALGARQIGDKRIEVSLRLEGATAVIRVTDNGSGIAPENLTRIFSNGFTTKRNGRGYGLHYCALAAGEMGGKLSVSSDGVDRGATFALEVPVNAAEGIAK